jgi:uncharacterized membrane protein
VNLAEKIQVKVYANQEKYLAGLKMFATLMISIVFCSLIIHEFFNITLKWLFFLLTAD